MDTRIQEILDAIQKRLLKTAESSEFQQSLKSAKITELGSGIMKGVK